MEPQPQYHYPRPLPPKPMRSFRADQIFMSQPVLHTPRLQLRPILLADAADVWAVYGDPEVGRLNLWTPLRNQQEAKQKIASFQQQFLSQQRLRWGICWKENGQLIGDCGFVHFDHRCARAEIGFNLARKAHRKGVMTEAVSAMIHYGFEMLAFRRIEAICLPENLPSIGLLKKIGFVQEGKLRQAGEMNGEPRDLLFMGLIPEDFC